MDRQNGLSVQLTRMLAAKSDWVSDDGCDRGDFPLSTSSISVRNAPLQMGTWQLMEVDKCHTCRLCRMRGASTIAYIITININISLWISGEVEQGVQTTKSQGLANDVRLDQSTQRFDTASLTKVVSGPSIQRKRRREKGSARLVKAM